MCVRACWHVCVRACVRASRAARACVHACVGCERAWRTVRVRAGLARPRADEVVRAAPLAALPSIRPTTEL
eukprot:2179382-Pleurochrysis_carterae.AAC.2